MIKQRMNREGKGDVTFFFDRMVNFRVDTINMNIYLFLKWPWQKRQLTPSDYIYDARNSTRIHVNAKFIKRKISFNISKRLNKSKGMFVCFYKNI